MLFHTGQFALFFTAVLLFARLAPGVRARNAMLAAANLAFAACFSLSAALLVALLATIAYATAALASRRGPSKGPVLAFGLTTLLAGIGVARLLEGSGRLESTVMPLSFSFVAFPLMAFVLDVAAGKLPLPPLLNFAAFAGFFPGVSSGPVVRPTELLPQIERLPAADPLRTRESVERFTFGLFKKVVIADRLGIFYNELDAGARGGAPLLYLAMFYVYALEVYFDFSGYTDMARATARALGFEIPENFRQPWRAESPIDWWRRWHISLATFLRDYVHYPLFFRTKNLFLCTSVTFMLNGIWHGIGLNYLFLGLYWSAAVSGYLAIRPWWDTRLPRTARILLTLQIAAASFIFFLPDGMKMFTLAISASLPKGGELFHALQNAIDTRNLLLAGGGIVVYVAAQRALRRDSWPSYVPTIYALWLFLFSCGLFSTKANFIYSQF